MYHDKIRQERIQFLQFVDYFSDGQEPQDFESLKQSDKFAFYEQV